MMSKFFRIIALFSFLLLTSCASVVRVEQPIQTELINLEYPNSIGQSFVARFDGLDGISLYIDPVNSASGQIFLHIRNSPQDTTDIAIAQLDVASIKIPGYYNIRFNSINRSSQNYYYISANVSEGTFVKIGIAPGSTYLNGALYVNQEPAEGQMQFNLSYQIIQLTFGLLRDVLNWLFWILIAVFLFIIPGWGLLSYFWYRWENFFWIEKLGLAGGLSLAIYPLLFLWTDAVGLHFGLFYAWIPILTGILLFALKFSQKRYTLSFSKKPKFQIREFMQNDTFWVNLVSIIFIIFIILIRFWSIRNLDYPLWGDSYQHTMISQLLLDNKGLFQSWEPYAAIESFSYHFGFHTFVAAFQWISQLPIQKAVLVTGQLLNIAAVIFLFPLASYIAKNRWAGVFTILIAGLLSPMPMYYVNWGRYTQLAGLTILPALIFFTWYFLHENNTSKDRRFYYFFLPILLSGLALTHYRVLIFAALFLLIILLFTSQTDEFKQRFKKLFIIGVSALALFSIWLPRLLPSGIFLIFTKQITKLPSHAAQYAIQTTYIGPLNNYLPMYLWGLFFFSIILSLIYQNKKLFLFLLWWLFALFVTNPQWLGLPGAGIITDFALFITAYIPVSITISVVFSWLLSEVRLTTPISRTKQFIFNFSLALVLVICSLWGLKIRRNDLNTMNSTLETRPDMIASEWINQNLSSDSKFLVNSFFAYGGSLIVGADGGWWLPMAAHRQNSVPPINYATEKGPFPDYRLWTNYLTKRIQDDGINNREVLNTLKERNYSHLYIGQRQGLVNTDSPLLKLNEILASPNYKPVYHQDHVWIFEIKY